MLLTPSAHQDSFTRDNLPPEDQWPTLEFTIPDVQYPDRLNAATALIDQPSERFGADRTALSTPAGETWTYGQLRDRANQIARVLTEDYGLVPGNRVMLRGPNNPWHVAAWLAVLKAGGVVVDTMPLLRSTEVLALIERTKPSAIIADHRFLESVEEVSEEKRPPVISYGSTSAADLVAQAAQKTMDFTNVETAADDVALLGPTSGTTGAPKLTMHFHRDILANADTFARHIVKPTADDVWACSAPLAFTFGLGCSVVFPLYFGGAVLLFEKSSPVAMAEQAAQAGVTILATAPTAYRALLKEGRSDLLSRLRIAISAGEHLPEAVWESVKKTSGLEIIDGIGATEMLHVFISASGDQVRSDAVGKPVPGYRATVLDEDGNEAPVGTVGRLAVIGPTGCRYLNDSRQTVYVENGWNVTGDAFSRDEEGYFIYQARTDNMIVSSGYNIGAPEVEAAIDLHPAVVENAVVGRPDPDRGTVVCAFVVLSDGSEADERTRKDIQDFVKQRIAPYKYPRDIRFIDELPRNLSGKLQHFKLRQQLAAEQAPEKTPAA
ncbi:AMP-binding protein [Nesterenkonia natronophila]|uniref:2-aminobenzoate-CoA ligase n=1 Tax=Nesterenkonia natronophila TaxID=2174932 RepID=A0A3A4F3K9_9MICC|nr:AMP-binding protein [Nesterenkonia natronophila]RJN32438.1 2-aminobenzoate-CoA ligase [Nesterenkonia natronophila]